jgi:hypothetical protein
MPLVQTALFYADIEQCARISLWQGFLYLEEPAFKIQERDLFGRKQLYTPATPDIR